MDDTTSLRAQQEYDARVAAEAAAAASAREVAAAQAALKALQDAGAGAGDVVTQDVLAPGAFGSPTFAPSQGGAIEEGFFDAPSSASGFSVGLLALLALGGAALLMTRRGRR